MIVSKFFYSLKNNEQFNSIMNGLRVCAVSLFDNIINSYPRTRFANDAIFYKALTLKKMGRPANEYNDLLLSVKRGGFADTLVFSQKVNDYVPAAGLVNEQMVQY